MSEMLGKLLTDPIVTTKTCDLGTAHGSNGYIIETWNYKTSMNTSRHSSHDMEALIESLQTQIEHDRVHGMLISAIVDNLVFGSLDDMCLIFPLTHIITHCTYSLRTNLIIPSWIKLSKCRKPISAKCFEILDDYNSEFAIGVNNSSNFMFAPVSHGPTFNIANNIIELVAKIGFGILESGKIAVAKI
jgi:hypothetical protein